MIEMLLVLSIVMVMTSAIILVSTNKLDKVEEKRFFRQFHLDMQRLQMIAIGEEKYVSIKFAEGGSKYIGSSANIILVEHKMPKGIRLSRDSPLKEIAFHPNGSIREFGVLIFETKKELKRVTVYIGKGKLNYEE